MVQSLAAIKQPVEKELIAFEKHFRNAMRSKVALLDKIMYYIVRRKGKQMRPLFVFLSAAVFHKPGESCFRAASLVELLHTATLVHDDVVDDAFQRRGFFSINALWKNKVAVLVGDYLLSRGLLLALENKEFRLLEIVSQAVREMSEGELLQMEKARKLDIEEAVYYDIIRQKTASLIASCCAAGAASVIDNEETIEKMRLFGEKIGIAFQIRDDLFDFGDQEVGKPRGIDLKEKKLTLPVIYALDNAEPALRKQIIRKIRKNHNEKDKVQEVIAFVKESGGLDYAREAMNKYRQDAFDILYTLPDNPARQSLEQLVRYVTERKK